MMPTLPLQDESVRDPELTFFRTLYLSMPEFVWMRDLQGRYLAANPSYCALMGKAESEIIGRMIGDFFPEDVSRELLRQDHETAESAQPRSYETKIVGGGGRQILADIIKVAVRHADGTLFGILGIARDIADRHRSEALLRASEARYRGFFSDSRAVMLLVDPDDGRIVDANAAACAYYGYDAERIRELNISDINTLTPDEIAREMQLARAQARDHFYFSHRLSDGRIRQVEVLSGPFEVDERGLLYSIVHDITEQRLAETRVAESEALYRNVVNQVQDVIYQADTEGRWTFLNPAWEHITGYALSESLGRSFLDFIHPDDHAHALNAYERLVEGTIDTFNTEVRLLHRDGGERHIEGSMRLICLPEDGQPVIAGISGTLRDVTENRKAEELQRLANSVFDHAHDGIVITDARERILDVNDTFCAQTGYSREELIGKTPRLLSSGRQSAAFYSRMWQRIHDLGHWRGEIWNRRKNGELYAELLTITAVRTATGEVSHYVGVTSDITQSKRHQEELDAAVHHDTLTGLPNRLLLGDRLASALEQATPTAMVGIACLDLDGFKALNDTMGHRAGNKVLKAMARRLERGLKPEDTVARPGGDEFILLVGGIATLEDGEREFQRILSLLSEPLQVGGETVDLTASIGFTLYPTDGDDADTLLRHADQAMYHAKELGRNRIHRFDPEHGRRVQVHRDVRVQIESALERQELVLFYQPKVDMRTGQVLGAEALVRWNHPERGLLGPGAFLPHIEESDLIVKVGEWVLEEALRQMGVWHRNGLHLPVSVNVAPRQLQTPDFCERLAERIAGYPELPSGTLQLEVLESTALDDMKRIGEIIQDCRALGVPVALDDFGTGYSTLTYLKRLPADQLKIDKSFVGDMLGDPGARAIVEAVIGLADAFKRTVIAEGAETPEHCAMLMRMGCDVAQGYGIAKPMPAAELPGWVAAFRPHPLWGSQLPATA
ncbi:Cyclic di-GMP phosphodiesterase Gmr [compost metagenome]